MIYIVYAVTFILLVLIYTNIKSKKKNLAIVLGSGGHTAEMIITLK